MSRKDLDWTKIVIVDVEATCDEPTPPDFVQEIIEIGVAVVDLPSLTIEKSGSILIEPYGPISKFCTELTTITAEDLQGKPSFREGCGDLVAGFGSKRHPWMSWGDFDRKLFEKQCQREKVSYPFTDSHTNMRVLFAWWKGLSRRVGMDRALEMLGVPLEGTHHRGVDDARNIAKIFIEFMKASRR